MQKGLTSGISYLCANMGNVTRKDNSAKDRADSFSGSYFSGIYPRDISVYSVMPRCLLFQYIIPQNCKYWPHRLR